MTQGDSDIVIQVDHREMTSGLPFLLEELGVRIAVQQLKVGDYVLSSRMAVERKTAADLASSIIDRRLFTQVETLKANYEQVIFLLEGSTLYEASNVHPNAIRGALSYLVILEDISLLRTEGTKDSAAYLATMARHEQEGLGYEVSHHHTRRSASPQLQKRYLVEDLPGIGPKMADALLQEFGTLRALFNAEEGALRQVYGIGPKRAKDIHALLITRYEGSAYSG
ncbi:MAG: ERCC4 domain-containing protein [Anaerolineales bacterium]